MFLLKPDKLTDRFPVWNKHRSEEGFDEVHPRLGELVIIIQKEWAALFGPLISYLP